MPHDNVYLPIRFYEPGPDERAAYIAYCGAQMQACYAAGNREAAENWLQAQAEAIAGRTPDEVLALEVERGLAPCGFTVDGERLRAQMMGAQS